MSKQSQLVWWAAFYGFFLGLNFIVIAFSAVQKQQFNLFSTIALAMSVFGLCVIAIIARREQ